MLIRKTVFPFPLAIALDLTEEERGGGKSTKKTPKKVEMLFRSCVYPWLDAPLVVFYHTLIQKIVY